MKFNDIHTTQNPRRAERSKNRVAKEGEGHELERQGTTSRQGAPAVETHSQSHSLRPGKDSQAQKAVLCSMIHKGGSLWDVLGGSSPAE